jgi:hypothetical protein
LGLVAQFRLRPGRTSPPSGRQVQGKMSRGKLLPVAARCGKPAITEILLLAIEQRAEREK